MTLIEAVEFCEDYECKICPAYNLPDCRTDFEKQELHYPCYINLVDEKERNKLIQEWRKYYNIKE